ncbi:MAG: hypothetical protein AAFQ98_03980 [Bacteroidota bacterium]
MRTYHEADLAHWETLAVYRLVITDPQAFVRNLLGCLPVGTRVSIEGELSSKIKPTLQPSLEETQQLKRNTLAPEMDFWVFRLDEKSLRYLQQELVPLIGNGDAVLHLLAEYQSKLLFGAHDKFDEESTHIACGASIPVSLLEEQRQLTTLHTYQPLPLAKNPT